MVTTAPVGTPTQPRQADGRAFSEPLGMEIARSATKMEDDKGGVRMDRYLQAEVSG